MPITPLIIEANGRSLSDLDQVQIQEDFKQRHLVLFRGFPLSMSKFAAFAGRFGEMDGGFYGPIRYRGSPLRNVYTGVPELPLHTELANGPMRPDQIWFCCFEPSKSGGETLICDGVELANHLPPGIRAEFESRRVKYHHMLTKPMWTRGNTTRHDFEQAFGAVTDPDFWFAFDDEEVLRFTYVSSAFYRTRYAGELAFANRIMTGGALKEFTMTWEDHSEFDPEMMKELYQLADQLSYPIAWQAMDLAMLDNTQLLHGRRAYVGSERKIMVREQRALF